MCRHETKPFLIVKAGVTVGLPEWLFPWKDFENKPYAITEITKWLLSHCDIPPPPPLLHSLSQIRYLILWLLYISWFVDPLPFSLPSLNRKCSHIPRPYSHLLNVACLGMRRTFMNTIQLTVTVANFSKYACNILFLMFAHHTEVSTCNSCPFPLMPLTVYTKTTGSPYTCHTF